MAGTIKRFHTAFGGVSYRVNGDKNIVRYQTLESGDMVWKTKARESREAFDAYAEETGLYDPYDGDNPAIVARRISLLNREW